MIRKIPRVLKEFAEIFEKSDYQIFLVGGAVRNRIMALPLTDFDLTTNALPEDVQKLFRRVIPTGIKHGTVTVLFRNHEFEVTTFRVDSDYSNQRHPDKVEFSEDIYEDLKRRDFTINSIALNLVDGEIIDPHGGQTDIRKKIIRAIGNPVDRFNEDGLRLMRAVRFMAQLNFDIEDTTLSAIKICKNNLTRVSAERVRDEIIKILYSEKPSGALFLMDQTGLLGIILPELIKCKGITQKANHDYDVFEHSVFACDGAPRESLVLRLAALLHDIGKPESLNYDEQSMPTFHRHEYNSSKSARKILKRLKFPIKIENDVCHLIENHMFNYHDNWSDSAVRRFLAKVGTENVDSLFSLRRADQYGMRGTPVDSANLVEFKKHIGEVLSEEHALKIKDLDINGNLLHTHAGVPKGPLMGVVLGFLLESVFEDPGLNKREKLLEMAINFYKTRINPEQNG